MSSPLLGGRFPLAEGLAIQDRQLKRWLKILKPECYEKLHRKAVEENKTLPKDATGYDVWRGRDMDHYISNEMSVG